MEKLPSLIVILIAVVTLIGWDVYAALHPTHETLSGVIWWVSRHHPIVPFAFGLLMGHFFWR